jgi:hypothetical protein
VVGWVVELVGWLVGLGWFGLVDFDWLVSWGGWFWLIG